VVLIGVLAVILTLTYGVKMLGLIGIGSMLSGLGGLAGGLSSIFGGGNDNAARQFEMQGINAYNQRQLLERQIQFQQEMAQNGIRYRVDDAKRAGISPLVALGAPTFSPTVSAGDSGIPFQPVDGGGGNLGRGLEKMGQGLGDLLRSQQTEEMKRKAVQEDILFNQQVKSNDMDIAIKGAQLGKLRMMANQPGAATVATVDPTLGKYKSDPAKVTTELPGSLSTTAGPATPESTFVKTPTGFKPVPSKGTPAGDNPEIFSPEYARWAGGNLVTPNASRAPSLDYVRKSGFPYAAVVTWDPTHFQWRVQQPIRSPTFGPRSSTPPRAYFERLYDRWFK